ncbi:Uncharacterized SAM-dependent O-methyltransferase [hydrothermal vent metagenome]|uniref:Uncharacterized SAM-dependent O-methyltransferase n=1 Tax=hydrothermal vent metagenome TaxID=652676 RepID=A0A3B0X0Z0_9ZZZZ
MKPPFKSPKRTAQDAHYEAQKIAFSPMTFQAVRIAWKRGLLEALSQHDDGLTPKSLSDMVNMRFYGVRVILESCLSIGVVEFENEKYFISKTGQMFLYDEMTQINMNYNHDVNYLGMFYLEEAIDTATPAGLNQIFGDWPTIYPALTSLPKSAKTSWFEFNHYYSDNAFPTSLPHVFKHNPKKLMDIGGNTGKFSMAAAHYNDSVQITIVDLPEQLAVAKTHISQANLSHRIHTYPTNMLDHTQILPKGFDTIWMSQFLDCFGDEDIIAILKRSANAMTKDSRLFILETYWDNQRFEETAFCVVNTSLYFTAMANGTSRMYRLSDMLAFLKEAGLQVTNTVNDIGMGHTLLEAQLIK